MHMKTATITRTYARIALLLLLLFGLTACGLYYRVPVQQGNIINPNDVARLEPGMSKQQVHYLMGTPLAQSSFDNNRWNYVFYYRDPRAHVRQSSLSLYFIGDKLDEVEGKQEFLQASRGGKLTDSSGAPLDAQ